jgi:hypothetical protein
MKEHSDRMPAKKMFRTLLISATAQPLKKKNNVKFSPRLLPKFFQQGPQFITEIL